MKQLDRRRFFRESAMAAGASLFFAQLPEATRAAFKKFAAEQPLGFQTFPIRAELAKDFPGTLRHMADMGYKIVEMCSPQGYAQIGFGPLVNIKPPDMVKIINDAGLTCPSCHFGFGEMKEDKLDQSIEWSKQMGLQLMVCSTFWLPKTATLKDYQDSADILNKAAEKIKAAGMQCGFHNHEMEFAQLDGQLIYDALLKQFDLNLVKMQFQTEVINLGYKAADYFNKFPGRFISSHLSDWTAEKKQVPIGQGVIDWKDFFTAAKRAGVQYYYVEMDPPTFKDSAAYLHKLLAA